MLRFAGWIRLLQNCSFVARVSEAKPGSNIEACNSAPGHRFAHPGYGFHDSHKMFSFGTASETMALIKTEVKSTSLLYICNNC